MEVEGAIKVIGQTQTFGSNGFQKRELVVTTEEQYPQHIMIEFVQDKCDLLNAFAVGQGVKIGINIRGREWVNPQGEVKYFNSIQGWRIESISGAENANNAQEMLPMPPADTFDPANDLDSNEHDDLPF